MASTKNQRTATSLKKATTPSMRRRSKASRTPQATDSREVLLSFARLGLLGTRW